MNGRPSSSSAKWCTLKLIWLQVHGLGYIHVDASHRPSTGKVCVDQTVPLWNLPQYHKDMPWNVAHLFSRAYEGWLRAMSWLQDANQGLGFATDVSDDWNSQVMQMWTRNHHLDYIQCPIPVDLDKKVYTGVLADVSDRLLPRATSHSSNLLATCSPPCPSWSRGGKNIGV